jgi:hypothetical protein
MGLILFIPAQQEKAGCKNIVWQVASVSGPEKTGDPFPGFNGKIQIIDAYLEKELIAANKKFVLQGLFGVCNFRAIMLDEVFHPGCKNYLNAQYPCENLLHGIPEAGSNLVCVYQ